MITIAVIGHVEWVRFARVARLPRPGEIALAKESWAEAAGGGAIAAVEVARLVDGNEERGVLYTVFGDDEAGGQARRGVERPGLRVEAAYRGQPHPIVFTQLTDDGERTITVMSPPLGPSGSDPLPWDELGRVAAVYFCKGDATAAQAARAAPILVATARAAPVLVEADIEVDVLVLSGDDETERAGAASLRRPAAITVTTERERGGRWVQRTGGSGRWSASAPPGPVHDSYGAGDAFAGALTLALARAMPLDAALAFAASSGAAALCRAGGGTIPPPFA